MNLLEKILPSLRRSPQIASIKKDLQKEKEKNIRARNNVLRSIAEVVDEFEFFQHHNGREG